MSDIFSDEIATEARKYVGLEYKTGTRAQCANFACTVLSEAGADLEGRGSDLAYELNKDIIGPKIDISEVRSGDLIFFSDPGQIGARHDNPITHVGIVDKDANGNIFVIHKSTSTTPIKRSIVTGSNYYKDKVFGFRRVNKSAITTGDTGESTASNGSGGEEWKLIETYKYTVKPEDNLENIARAAGVTVTEIVDSNPSIYQTQNGRIELGQELSIPFAPIPSAPSPGVGAGSGSNNAGIPVDSAGNINPVDLAEFIYNELEGSPLIGMGQNGTTKTLEDGAVYGINTGTREEWTRLFVALANKESTLYSQKYGDRGKFTENGKFIDGSRGVFQISEVDFNQNYKGILPPLTGTREEKIAKLNDPAFNVKAAIAMATSLITGTADATRGKRVTRLGWINPSDPTKQPEPNSYQASNTDSLSRYWGPFQGDSDSGNIDSGSFAIADRAIEALRNNIEAREAQAAQRARQETPILEKNRQKVNEFIRENERRDREFERERSPFESQPAPEIDEQLLRNATFFNFGGGAININSSDYEKQIEIASEKSFLKFNDNVQLFSEGSISTAASDIFTTATGSINSSAPSKSETVTEDRESRLGSQNYDTIEQAKETLLPRGLRNSSFDLQSTDGPVLDPILHIFGEHQPAPESGHRENPTISGISGEDLPALLIQENPGSDFSPDLGPAVIKTIFDENGKAIGIDVQRGEIYAPGIFNEDQGGMEPGTTGTLIQSIF
jgi:hypothetical protein